MSPTVYQVGLGIEALNWYQTKHSLSWLETSTERGERRKIPVSLSCHLINKWYRINTQTLNQPMKSVLHMVGSVVLKLGVLSARFESLSSIT